MAMGVARRGGGQNREGSGSWSGSGSGSGRLVGKIRETGNWEIV